MLELFLYDLKALAIGAVIWVIFMRILAIAFCIFAVIGFISTIRFFIKRKKRKQAPKEDPHKVWLKTGKWPD